MVIAEMTRYQCVNFLAHARLGRLACASNDQPYVVPVYFACQDPFLYSFTMPGQKVEWMRANPRVCVQFDEIGSSDDWTSIVVFGQYEELPDSTEWRQERLRAHGLLQQRASWWEPGGAAREGHAMSPAQPIYYRIRIEKMTGRRASPNPS
jgi:nitroimidazol reductase NimA-like FMN-containing flavoprotein (pyridoxamine 5'-phosphate oxidase superfamily)